MTYHFILYRHIHEMVIQSQPYDTLAELEAALDAIWYDLPRDLWSYSLHAQKVHNYTLPASEVTNTSVDGAIHKLHSLIHNR